MKITLNICKVYAFFKKKIYLAASDLSCGMWDLRCGALALGPLGVSSCSMQTQ